MPQEQQLTMDQVRERFPEYDDMDDMELANAIHGRFYSDIPLGEFYAQVGFNPDQDAGDNGIYPTMRPNQAPVGTPQHEMDPEQATANAAAFGAQGTQLDPIDLATLPAEDRAYLNAGMYVRLGNGEVRRMMADARPNAGGAGTQEIRPGLFIEENADLGTDIAKSLPTGVVEGLTGTVGALGSLYDMVPESLRSPTSMMRLLPSGAEMNEGIRDQIGYDYYQPQTVAGEYARTAGEFLPGAIAPGGVGAKAASWLVPAATSETAGQIARGMSGGQRGTDAENYARLLGGLGGGFLVGGANMVRSGGDTVLRNAAEGVTPQQLQMAAALRQRGGLLGVDLTNAEALQQATGGATGLGRLQRVVEGQTARMAPTFAARPGQVQQAIANELDRIGPSVEPSALAPRVQQASAGVLNTLRRRANEDAGPFYRNLPGQSLPPEQFQQLTENPSFAAALRAVRGDEELAPLLSAELPMDEATRMLRAQQQGFTTEGYRGAAGDAPLFSNSREAQRVGTFFTSDPAVASTYAPPRGGAVFPVLARESRSVVAEGRGNNWARLPQDTPIQTPEIRVSRAEDNDLLEALGQPRGAEFGTRPAGQTTAGDVAGSIGDYVSTDRLADWARRQGFGGLRTNNVIDVADSTQIVAPSNVSTVFSPDDLRSRFDAFSAPTPDNDLNVLNETVKQLRTMADEAAPNSMRVGGSNTRAAQRSEAAALADALASEVSPDWRMARDTVRGVNEAFIDPLKAGPIGALADSSEAAPNLAAMTGRLFPDAPFEGQAAETARALELMGEIDPSVGGPLVRQHLSRQAMEAQQQLATGDNQFGGANFAARAFGNPEQRRTVMGAIDATAPPPSPLTFPPLNPNAPQAMPSDPMTQLVEVLQATGQRHRGGSETAFNTEAIQNLRGGNLATGVAQTATNPLGVFGRAGRGIDDWTARRNAESLADLLMANSEDFNARLTRAINRPRGANRIRAGATISAGQED